MQPDPTALTKAELDALMAIEQQLAADDPVLDRQLGGGGGDSEPRPIGLWVALTSLATVLALVGIFTGAGVVSIGGALGVVAGGVPLTMAAARRLRARSRTTGAPDRRRASSAE